LAKGLGVSERWVIDPVDGGSGRIDRRRWYNRSRYDRSPAYDDRYGEKRYDGQFSTCEAGRADPQGQSERFILSPGGQ
jgi:hypothetical protein